MTKYYAETDIEIDGQKYTERVAELPSVTEEAPEFMAGIETPGQTTITLNNRDDVLTDLAIQKPLRGKAAIIKQYFKTQNETIIFSKGIVDRPSIDLDAVFSLSPHQLDILQDTFPFETITTDLFPDAIDTGYRIPFPFGYTLKVPCALIKALEDVSGNQFQYLVARGDHNIDVVYRDKLVLKYYPGTAQSSTSTTIKLDATDTKNDDFYNLTFIEITAGTGAGQVRKITDYNSSTKDATVDTAWDTNPDDTSVYKIREWKKILLTINSVQYTCIEFAIAQREKDRLFQRDRMSADISPVAGATTRNPARAVETVLNLYNLPMDVSAFTTAASQIDSIGDLYSDGAAIEEKTVFDVVNELCLIGRIRLRLNDNRVFEPVIDGQNNIVWYQFTEDSIESIDAPEQESLSNLWKNLSVKYRKQFDVNQFRLTSTPHDVFTDGGKIEKVLDFDFVYEKVTADKVCDYAAKRKVSMDIKTPVSLGNSARARIIGDLIYIKNDKPRLNDIYEIVRRNLNDNTLGFGVSKYDPEVFNYNSLTLPSDPVSDARADFRNTPPDAVEALGVNWTEIIPNQSVNAELSWTNPTENYKEVRIQYKKSTDSVYNDFTTVPNENATIPNLEPGLEYDFQLISVNQFDLPGGVAFLPNELAPGDTIPPPDPTGFVVDKESFTDVTWKWDIPNIEDYDVTEWELATTSGGAAIDNDEIKGGRLTLPLKDSGDLTTIITRWLRIRHRDLSGQFSNWSSWVSGSTKDIRRDDVRNNDITAKSDYENSGSIAVGSGLTTVGSTFLTVHGYTVYVWASLTIDVGNTGGAGGSFDVYLYIDSSPISAQRVHLTDGDIIPVALSGKDVLSAGSHNFYLKAGNTLLSSVTVKNRILLVEELQR